MARARTTMRTLGLLGAAALVATGCGGGDVPPADPGATATPGATTPGDAVVDPNAPTIDPVTGQPVDPAAAAAEAEPAATIPSLDGDDIGGGLSAVGGSPIFEAGAIALGESETGAEGDGSSELGSDTTEKPAVEKAPAVVYGGAKIYVDGIVHDVDKGGTFPKGNPVFRLLSVSAGDIEIELVAGEFSTNGGSGTILDKGELVSMLNTSESLTYRIKYLRPITGTDAVSF